MKAAISSTGTDLSAEIDPRFGRCQYFLIVEIDSMEVKSISNESAMASGGAGIQAAQAVMDEGVKIVITGQVGPNAYQTLSAEGVKIYTGAAGSVKDVIEQYKAGKLNESSSSTVGSHAGMRGGSGQGRGMGGGGGRGMGGRGMRRGGRDIW